MNRSSESPWNEDAKIGIGLISNSNTSRENQQNVFTKKKLGFIDVLQTVAINHYSNKFSKEGYICFQTELKTNLLAPQLVFGILDHTEKSE